MTKKNHVRKSILSYKYSKSIIIISEAINI